MHLTIWYSGLFLLAWQPWCSISGVLSMMGMAVHAVGSADDILEAEHGACHQVLHIGRQPLAAMSSTSTPKKQSLGCKLSLATAYASSFGNTCLIV